MPYPVFRVRAFLLLFLCALVPLGFYLRFRAPIAPGLRDATGGAAYVIFWSALVLLLWPSLPLLRVVCSVLAVTCALEFLQQWQPAWLQAIRSTLIGRLVLGTTYDPNDFPPYFAGAGLCCSTRAPILGCLASPLALIATRFRYPFRSFTIQEQSMLITRKVEFSASHVCRVESLSNAENQRLFGPGANPNGHGHNYVVEVTVEGQPDTRTGMVMDLKDLKQILQEEIVDPMDHRFLNREVPPFDSVIPTAENLAMELWKRVDRRVHAPSARLFRVRLYETAEAYVDVFRKTAAA